MNIWIILGIIVIAVGSLMMHHGASLSQDKSTDDINETQTAEFKKSKKDRETKHDEVIEKIEETAEAKRELEKIKAPRTLSLEQQNRILNKLKQFPGTTFVTTTYPGQPEAVEFSNAIADTLVRAGWIFNPNNSRGSLLGSAEGIVVVVGKQAGIKAEEKGKALLDALISEDILATLGYNSLVVNPIAIEIKIQVANKKYHY